MQYWQENYVGQKQIAHFCICQKWLIAGPAPHFSGNGLGSADIKFEGGEDFSGNEN